MLTFKLEPAIKGIQLGNYQPISRKLDIFSTGNQTTASNEISTKGKNTCVPPAMIDIIPVNLPC